MLKRIPHMHVHMHIRIQNIHFYSASCADIEQGLQLMGELEEFKAAAIEATERLKRLNALEEVLQGA